MSDSILYLAIVAIWAVVLIPAWLRHPQASRTDQGPELAADYAFDTVTDITADNDTDNHVEVPEPVSEYRDDVHPHSYDQAAFPAQAPETLASPASRPSQSREQMMRARRRMFTILAGLTLLTLLFVLSGLVQWWICVPPFAMLVLYLMLLREIATAEAELARKRHAWEAGQARAQADRAKAAAWQRSHQVWEEAEAAEAAGPTAEIIDISARVGDQLYDQYADAAVRAVGD